MSNAGEPNVGTDERMPNGKMPMNSQAGGSYRKKHRTKRRGTGMSGGARRKKTGRRRGMRRRRMTMRRGGNNHFNLDAFTQVGA